MRTSILITIVMLPLLTLTSRAAAASASEFNGFSSEDWGSGSYLGVDTRDITPDRLAPLHLKDERGVEVTMVDQDAPAGKAGLKENDVIVTMNGTDVQSVEQLRRMIRETPPGRVVTLGISRDGQMLSIKVELGDRKKSLSFDMGPDGKQFKFNMPVMPALPALPDMDLPVSVVVVHSAARSGLMIENLTPQLGDFFGAKNGQGVLVRSVEKGSRADKAGFRAGDVIVKVNGEPIHDSGDFSHALRSLKDNTASISFMRDKKEQTVTITLPEHKQSELRESLDLEIPALNAKSREEISQVNKEMAHLKPEMEEAINRQIQQVKPEIERQTSDAHKRAQEFQRQMRDLQRELRDHQREIERELRHAMEGSSTEL
jgi:membrane-associated protease RseP (regulator of RpoE activity)